MRKESVCLERAESLQGAERRGLPPAVKGRGGPCTLQEVRKL